MHRNKYWPWAGLIALSVAGCAVNARTPPASESPQLGFSNASLAFPQFQMPKGQITFPPVAATARNPGDKTALPTPCDVNDNMPTGGTRFDSAVRMPNGSSDQQNALGKLRSRFWNAVRMPNPCVVEDSARKRKAPRG